jgi:hypothetical protein
MSDNTKKYGFRWVGSLDGSCYPKPQEHTVLTAYQATVSATNVDLNIGDPVQLDSNGTIVLGANGSPSTLYGVIVGFSNVKVGLPLKGRKFSRLPGGTTWTTEENRSKVLVVPFGRNLWEVDCDDKTTATTAAAYRLFIGENCDMTYLLDTTDADRPKANPMLDISDHGTATKSFRIQNISGTALNQDFSGLYVKLIVSVNESQEAPFVTTGV